ncbi:hypothetical protein DFH27DRAFT_597484 [Peziza echinospora]|nr:hypothetical protein DFH27DRAFT_597484 [Peziza echinospora]
MAQSFQDSPPNIKSPFFKIVVVEGGDEGQADTKGAAENVLYIHKAVLAGLSPELEKHVNNDMKEGRNNTLVVREVDYSVMQMFVEFAYTQSYTLPEDTPGGKEILIHVKLFSLADRFNVQKLMEVSFENLTSDLQILGSLMVGGPKADTLDYIMQACLYAFANLPTRPPTPAQCEAVRYEGSDNTAAGAFLLHFVSSRVHYFARCTFFEDYLELDLKLAKRILCFVSVALPCLEDPWEYIYD